MREIKFRAWDKDSKSWVDDVLLTCNEYGFLYQNYNKCEFMGEDRDIVLMQYTGLKDKNGEEIYEGDIIETQYGIKHEVIFNDGAWELACTGNRAWTYFNITIIGNIYENPELLEEK